MIIHLTDAQHDTFAACGLIVIDGEADPATFSTFGGAWRAPEGWRILTEPCDTCGGSGVERIPAEVHGGKVPMHFDCADCEDSDDWYDRRRVVTLTATCPQCEGKGWYQRSKGVKRVPTVCGPCDESGVVTLGRFTIPALLPHRERITIRGPLEGPDGWFLGSDDPPYEHEDEVFVFRNGYVDSIGRLDPPPRPGQFIARPERVG